MSNKGKTIRLDRDVYDELTKRKDMRNISYDQLLRELLAANPPERYDINTMLKNAEERAAKFKGKRVKIDYDEILYGVSEQEKREG